VLAALLSAALLAAALGPVPAPVRTPAPGPVRPAGVAAPAAHRYRAAEGTAS
jgi:hypothetical protein